MPLPLPPTSPINFSLQTFNPRAKALDNIPNMPYFIKFDLQFVNLPKYFVETRDFGVGGSDRFACSCRLRRRRDLCLRR